MIDGLILTPLPQFMDERGKVMKMLSRESPAFRGFGEVYFTTVHPGKVKGWNHHARTTLNFAVPVGHIKLVVFDDRPASPTRGEVWVGHIGPENYQLVTIPPGVWVSFGAIGARTAVICNCADQPHDPAELSRRPLGDPAIPFSW